jgi:hypothetical protein
MRPDELDRQLRQRLDGLGPTPRAELLHVLMLPDFERAALDLARHSEQNPSMAEMQSPGPSDSELGAQASDRARSGGRWVKGRTGRRLRSAILLALLIIGVPVMATLVGGWGVAIWLVLGAFALLVLGPLIKAP